MCVGLLAELDLLVMEEIDVLWDEGVIEGIEVWSWRVEEEGVKDASRQTHLLRVNAYGSRETKMLNNV